MNGYVHRLRATSSPQTLILSPARKGYSNASRVFASRAVRGEPLSSSFGPRGGVMLWDGLVLTLVTSVGSRETRGEKFWPLGLAKLSCRVHDGGGRTLGP